MIELTPYTVRKLIVVDYICKCGYTLHIETDGKVAKKAEKCPKCKKLLKEVNA